MDRGKKWSVILYISFAVMVSLLYITINHSISILTNQVVHGTMEISSSQLKNSIYKMDGEWMFYQGFMDNLNIKQSSNSTVNYRQVPSVEKGKGSYTYSLVVRIMDYKRPQLLALKIPHMSTAYQVYVDDECIFQAGEPSATYELTQEEYKRGIAYFQADQEEFTITFYISNAIYARTGFWYSIYLGTPEEIQDFHNLNISEESIFVGILLVMGIYHIFSYFIGVKVSRFIYLGFVFIVGALRVAFTGEYIIQNYFDFISMEWLIRIEYLTIVLGTGLFTLYLEQLYPIYRIRFWSVYTKFIILILSFGTSVISIYHMTGFLNGYLIATLLSLIYCLHIVGKAYVYKASGASVMLVSVIVFIATIWLDVLYQKNYLSIMNTQVIPIFGIFLVLTQSMIIANSFGTIYRYELEREQDVRRESLHRENFLKRISASFGKPVVYTEEILNHINIMINELEISEVDKQELRKYLIDISEINNRLKVHINDSFQQYRMFDKSNKSEYSEIRLEKVIKDIVSLNIFQYPNQLSITLKLEDCIVYTDRIQLSRIIQKILDFVMAYSDEKRLLLSMHKEDEWSILQFTIEALKISSEEAEIIWSPKKDSPGIDVVSQELFHSGIQYLYQLVDEIQMKIDHYYMGKKMVIELRLSNLNENLVHSQGLIKKDSFFDKSRWIEANKHRDNEVAERKKILFVAYDEYEIRRLTKSLQAYDIIPVTNTLEISEVLQWSIHLIIFNLVGTPGEIFEEIKKIRGVYNFVELPIVCINYENNSVLTKKLVDIGVNEILVEPIDSITLEHKIESYIRLKEATEKLLESKMLYLQAQIRPHFLYNTLNTVLGLMNNDPIQAEELLLDFSDYLRKSIRFWNDQEMISIHEELDYTRLYTNIEKARYGDRLKVEVIVDPFIDVLIPPLMIQPLVENAIKHNVENRIEKTWIRVQIENMGRYVEVKVEDNGNHFEKRTSLGEDKKKGKASGNGIGLANIRGRVQFYFDQELKLEVNERGTTVTFRIPRKNI